MFWAWTSLLIRSGAILGAAELLRRWTRRSPAAQRHRVVAAAFSLLLIWPVVSALLPEVSLSVLPAHTAASVTVSQTSYFLDRTPVPVKHVNWPLSIWALGFLLSLLPLALGHLKVRRMVSSAVDLDDESWQSLLRQESSRLALRCAPELLYCQGSVVPLTCGILRPRILLPAECMDWEPVRRRAVLLHELMHVRRRDLVWQMFAQITTALWWFQPLCWISRRSLRQESEQACDAWVLSSGVRASDYATELLGIARRYTLTRTGIPAMNVIVRRSDLEPRVRAILSWQPQHSGRFPSLKIALLIAVTLTASAVTVLPQQTDFEGGHSMKRTLISGLLISAGLTAATIGGSVFDPNGAAVSNAQVAIDNPDTGFKQEATTSPDGKFSFESLSAGSYILHIQKPGFASLYRLFNVQNDSQVQRGLTLGTPATSAKPDSSSSNEPPLVRIGGQLEEANLITKVQPVYPAAAKSAHVQGTVELDVAISKDGVPEDIKVISSPSDDLTQSALESVRQWRYRPTLLNGQPVAIVTDVLIHYTLSQ